MKHQNVPYHGNPTNSYCALACATMIGQYLLPNEDITFEKMGELADYRPGYVVWLYPVWQWFMDRGIHIYDQDISDKDAWVRDGIEGLRASTGEKEFTFYQDNTYDLEAVTEQVRKIDNDPNYTYVQKRVAWDDVVKEFNKPGICDLTLNGKLLARKEGHSVHRVVLLDITEDEVVFHNPRVDNAGAFQRESISHFQAALASLDGAEICRYWV